MSLLPRIIAPFLVLTAATQTLWAQQDTAPAETVLSETGTDAILSDMAQIERAWQRGDYILVREGLKTLAESQGTPLAQYRYGRVLAEGRGGPRDLGAAVLWLERAVSQNHAEAATLLAQILLSDDLPDIEPNPARAASLLERAAARGNSEAQYRLGQLAAAGLGMARDAQIAFTWFLAAAEQGHVAAQFQLARAYSSGAGTAQDISEATRWLQEAAESGHLEAQVFLGLALEEGKLMPADLSVALRWYRRAAEAGLPLAQRLLGTHYLSGTGVEANAEEALRWLEAAAEAGDPGAMNNLGQAYLSGTLLPQDDARAYYWYERAASTDLPRALAMLAALVEAGRGTKPDLDRAISLYRKAAEANEKQAQQRLGEMAAAGMLDGRLAPQRAVPWAAVAAEAGDVAARAWLAARAAEDMPEAQAALGRMLLDTEHQPEAIDWLTRAASAGNVPSQELLGHAYARGDYGLTQDYVTAHGWLNLAAGAGDTNSAESRETIAALMTPEQIAEAQTAARVLFEGIAARVPPTVQTVRETK